MWKSGKLHSGWNEMAHFLVLVNLTFELTSLVNIS